MQFEKGIQNIGDKTTCTTTIRDLKFSEFFVNRVLKKQAQYSTIGLALELCISLVKKVN